MDCLIADLKVRIPEAGGLAPRCREYLTALEGPADIIISEETYNLDYWQGIDYDMACYMESGKLFYWSLPDFNGIMLHSSAVEYEGKVYLFSGPCTVGKSTHTRLWQQRFGDAVRVINDDKPALRLIDGKWYAYGTPWCGKDGINQNRKAELGGICFLRQSKENKIRRLSFPEATVAVMSQTAKRFPKMETMEKALSLIDHLIRNVPIYEMENFPSEEAVKLSYETMHLGNN